MGGYGELLRVQEDRNHKAAKADFATVAGVYADGLELIFPGESLPRSKRYQCNTAVHFSTGQRVRVEWAAGAYVVAYPVGLPAGVAAKDQEG